jgi:hypothetical protein
MLSSMLLLLFSLISITSALPEPTSTIAINDDCAHAFRACEPTQAPEEDLRRRGLGDDIGSYVDSLISAAESGVSSFVGSGILDFPSGFPTGSAVESSLGISSTDLDPEPTQVLNLPAYGNWTDKGWNVRVHGNVYKVPNISESKIDDLANVFLIGTDIDQLSSSEQAQARNVTRSIFVVQQGDESVTVQFVDNDNILPEEGDGGAISARGGGQSITLPYNTTVEGDFDTFVMLRNTTGSDGGHLIPGNQTSSVQVLDMFINGTESGNATAYLAPSKGITIVSDIDDILRVTKIYEPKQGLLNTFAKPFTPWMNMPDIYANWSTSLDNLHFHYLTTTPEQVTRNYMDFIYKTYPLGSFDTRPLNFSDLSATLSIRKFLLDKIFATFPQRQFILVGDTTNSDVMKDYPQLYKDHPDQVQCIFLRNTSATDDGDKFPYDTSGFKDIPQEHYMFFLVPDDLQGLDIAGGQCLNASVRQNVTFDTQGLPFGLSDEDGGAAAGGLVGRNEVMVGILAGMLVSLLPRVMF